MRVSDDQRWAVHGTYKQGSRSEWHYRSYSDRRGGTGGCSEWGAGRDGKKQAENFPSARVFCEVADLVLTGVYSEMVPKERCTSRRRQVEKLEGRDLLG